MHARLSLQEVTSTRRLHAPDESRMKLPSAPVVRGMSLNHPTVAADLVWIWSLVYLGRQDEARRQPRYLDEYARTIHELDPYFYPVYQWFAAAYLQSARPVEHRHLERIEAFLRRGFDYFPNDYQLPYTAGIKYIGYSRDRAPEVRLREIESAIELLQIASQKPGAPEDLLMTIGWLYERKRQLEAQISGDSAPTDDEVRRRQVDFFENMYYQVDDPRTRRRIRRILEDHGADEELLEKTRRHRKTLQRHHSTSFSYLPVGLWTVLDSEHH